MTKLKWLGAVAILSAAIAAPAMAQEYGPIGPGSRYGLQPEPHPVYRQGYNPEYLYPSYGYNNYNAFTPLDAAAGIVAGAVDTAGAIATAPFRAFDDSGSYAMMRPGESYCVAHFRTYNPRTGMYLGYDGRYHSCG